MKRYNSYGIAGWPLRDLSIDVLARLALKLPIIELPKDLLNTISVKELFSALASAGKETVLAGTTDFARLSGLAWQDYRRYLDIQIANARFLRCKGLRCFLGAGSMEELKISLDRLATISVQIREIETLVETHGGFESTLEGFHHLIETTSHKVVVDFANIQDERLVEYILMSRSIGERIAYFHIRNLPPYCEAESTLEAEAAAGRVYPQHVFLWEPKALAGLDALRVFEKQYHVAETYAVRDIDAR